LLMVGIGIGWTMVMIPIMLLTFLIALVAAGGPALLFGALAAVTAGILLPGWQD